MVACLCNSQNKISPHHTVHSQCIWGVLTPAFTSKTHKRKCYHYVCTCSSFPPPFLFSPSDHCFFCAGKTADGKSVSGKIQALNVSEEYEPDEFDFEVSMSSDETPERRRVKEMVRKAGVEALRAKLSEWHKALRIEFTKGMILPTKDKAAKTTSSSSSSGVRIHSESQDAKADSSSSSGGGAGARGKFEIAEQFLCTPADLYQCFLDENVGGRHDCCCGRMPRASFVLCCGCFIWWPVVIFVAFGCLFRLCSHAAALQN